MHQVHLVASIVSVLLFPSTWAAVPPVPPLSNVVTVDVAGSRQNRSNPVPEAFVSYSIEFATFPDFAGTKEDPNRITNILLDNLGKIQGSRPILRIGGNTADISVYNPNQQQRILPARPPYGQFGSTGPSYFDAYNALPDTRYIHNFILGKTTAPEGLNALIDSIAPTCHALGDGKLLYWELGNEPDQYVGRGARPSNWTGAGYVKEWMNLTQVIQQAIATTPGCEAMARKGACQYIAPSFSTEPTHMKYMDSWMKGLNQRDNIAQISGHNYVADQNQTNLMVSIRNTLLNHTNTAASLIPHADAMATLSASGFKMPYILGEFNSVLLSGMKGLTDTFAAALWTFDFLLSAAATNIARAHMHISTDAHYNAWQPIGNAYSRVGTKAPYYGQIAAATMLGNVSVGAPEVSITAIPVQVEGDGSAYAALVDGKIARVAALNLREFNSSSGYGAPQRPSRSFHIILPEECRGALQQKNVTAQRLTAPGSDSLFGISFDGYSYQYDLNQGRPVKLTNATVDEMVPLSAGYGPVGVSVDVPDSSAVVVNVAC